MVVRSEPREIEQLLEGRPVDRTRGVLLVRAPRADGGLDVHGAPTVCDSGNSTTRAFHTTATIASMDNLQLTALGIEIGILVALVAGMLAAVASGAW